MPLYDKLPLNAIPVPHIPAITSPENCCVCCCPIGREWKCMDVEVRLLRLEDTLVCLAETQVRTETALARLAETQARTEEQLARLETQVQALADVQARTEQRLAQQVTQP